MDLLATLRYHADALAALRSYGNHGGARAAAVQAELDAALADMPAEVARLRAEAADLAEAGAEERADELYALADDLESFDSDAPAPVKPATRKGRRRGN
jgi:hypothetical protein